MPTLVEPIATFTPTIATRRTKSTARTLIGRAHRMSLTKLDSPTTAMLFDRSPRWLSDPSLRSGMPSARALGVDNPSKPDSPPNPLAEAQSTPTDDPSHIRELRDRAAELDHAPRPP